MKKQWMQIGLFVMLGFATQAVVQVENVDVVQLAGTKQVEIDYDVSSSLANTVAVSVQLYDGEKQVLLTNLSGDVGPGIETGAGKTIIWDAGADWNGQLGSCLQVWVVAHDGTETNPLPTAGSKLVLAGENQGSDPDFGDYLLSLNHDLLADQMEVDSSLWVDVYDWALAKGYDFDNLGIAASNNHPVVAINWYDSVKWCNARSEKDGFVPVYEVNGEVYRTGNSIPVPQTTDGYRLPTVEEWQYMARGCRKGMRFPWGDTIAHSNANYYSVASSYDVSSTQGYHPDYLIDWPGTSPCGAFAANGMGLYDMAGNVWEWCWDTAPEGRFMAGGSWQNSADTARCGATLGDAPANSRFNAGFRTVRSVSAFTGVVKASVDTRDYTLSVSSSLGNTTPQAGSHTYAWHASINCSADSMARFGGSNYYQIGWTGTGSVPASGTSQETGLVRLEDLDSSIEWNWQDGSQDYDADQLPNDWEMDYFGSFVGAEANLNTDGDMFSNVQEYIAGSDPTNPASFFSVTNHAKANGTNSFSMEWNAIPDRIYTVHWSTNLVSGFQPMDEEIEYPQNSYTNTLFTNSVFYTLDVRLK